MSVEENNELKERVSKRRSALGWDACTVVLSSAHPWSDVSTLLSCSDVESVIVPADSGAVPPREFLRVGVYYPETSGWILPRQLSPHLLVIGDLTISKRMAMRALAAGGRRIANETTKDQSLIKFLASKIRNQSVQQTAHAKNPNRHIINASTQTDPFNLNEDPLLPADAFDGSHVLMINSALAWGGAERQLVNTMIGLHERGRKVELVCEALNYVPDSDFFQWRLEQRDLKAHMIRKDYNECRDDIPEDLHHALMARIEKLPSPIKEMTAPYAFEMLARRPGVLHAWQDQTNIYAGIAASIVGIPRIVLATRNVSPVNFAYYQDHMPEAYRALLRRPNVRIINNSHAGVKDYCIWLGEGHDKFDLLYNGLDFTDMQTPTPEATRALRQKIGIAPGKKVLGSLFRLYEEKDPFLWLDTAVKAGRDIPDLDFVIFGVGPLRDALLKRTADVGMDGRLHLPGTEKNPALALSIMDAFLLTSRFEGLPNVVIEAQSQGVPVVTTKAGGSGEAILNGETGWLVDERDSSALADRVNAALADTAWRRNAIEKAPTFARARFGFDRMIDETAAIYNRISPRR